MMAAEAELEGRQNGRVGQRLVSESDRVRVWSFDSGQLRDAARGDIAGCVPVCMLGEAAGGAQE